MKHTELTEKIIGIFYDMYNVLGGGFLESVYENALCIALREAGLTCDQQTLIEVTFRRKLVGDFRADLIVENTVLLELKAVRAIDDPHIAQTLNYLKATRIEVGLILNFGPKPKIKRLVLDQ